MSALDSTRPPALAELLMSAAAQLAEAAPARALLVPMGVPVRRGRLHLGRLRGLVPAGEPAVVTVGFATAAWLGPRTVLSPNLGRLSYRAETSVDARGRVLLDLRVRAWLGVEDRDSFEVVAVPAEHGGLLVVPVEDFARRWEVVSG